MWWNCKIVVNVHWCMQFLLHFHINLEIFFPCVHFAQFVKMHLIYIVKAPSKRRSTDLHLLPVKGSGTEYAKRKRLPRQRDCLHQPKPPLCKGRWRGVSRVGGIVSKTLLCMSFKMIAEQSPTRSAGAPFAQGGLFTGWNYCVTAPFCRHAFFG